MPENIVIYSLKESTMSGVVTLLQELRDRDYKYMFNITSNTIGTPESVIRDLYNVLDTNIKGVIYIDTDTRCYHIIPVFGIYDNLYTLIFYSHEGLLQYLDNLELYVNNSLVKFLPNGDIEVGCIKIDYNTLKRIFNKAKGLVDDNDQR